MVIWLTNFLIFGLWYWELDRGGPGNAQPDATGRRTSSFRQMNDDRIDAARLAAEVHRLRCTSR